MAEYKVRKTGNNSDNGLTPETAWLTFDHATSTALAGDTVYIGSGVYRESVVLDNSGTSGNKIIFYADTDGKKTGDAGEVIITAHDNDNAVATRASCLDFNGRTFFELHGFIFLGGTSFVVGNTAFASATAYEGVVIENCTIQSGSATTALKLELNAGVTPATSGIQIVRNRIFGGIDIDWDSNASADVNAKMLVHRNLVFALGGTNTFDFTRVTNGGAFTIGGMTISNNTLFSSGTYNVIFTNLANTTNLSYVVSNVLVNPSASGIINSSGTAGAVIVHKNIVVGRGTLSSTCTEIPPNYVNVPVLMGGLHDGASLSTFGYSSALPFEPMAVSGYTNPAIDNGSNDYSQTSDLYGNPEGMGRASAYGHQYYFDASDNAITDTGNVWTTETNIFDASETTSATVGTAGSNASNFVFAGGTNAPASGETITKVQTRMLSAGSNATSRTLGWEVFTNGLAESLGSFTKTTTSATSSWSNWTDLAEPSGGWTWAKVQELEVKAWQTASNANSLLHKIEIGVVAEEPTIDIGAVEARKRMTQNTDDVFMTGDCAEFAGAGYQDFKRPVTATSTTITVKARYDSNYLGDNPKLEVFNIPGVVDQSDVMTLGANTTETLTVTFTPTEAGWIRVRLSSQDASETGKCFFDDLE